MIAESLTDAEQDAEKVCDEVTVTDESGPVENET